MNSDKIHSNLCPIENFINTFKKINISDNENEIHIEDDNIIKEYYMQPLNKRVKERIKNKKKIYYPKKRRKDSFSDKEEKKRKSVSKKKKGWK